MQKKKKKKKHAASSLRATKEETNIRIASSKIYPRIYTLDSNVVKIQNGVRFAYKLLKSISETS